ncbi:MAG: hypothetical protein GY862_27925 [Gammaproteobacteria bacterium]|nr:hypothetical protein [Gammaproteobacteria bacterium]
MDKKRNRTIRFSVNRELLVGGRFLPSIEKVLPNKDGHMSFMRVSNILRRMSNYGVYHKDMKEGGSAF